MAKIIFSSKRYNGKVLHQRKIQSTCAIVRTKLKINECDKSCCFFFHSHFFCFAIAVSSANMSGMHFQLSSSLSSSSYANAEYVFTIERVHDSYSFSNGCFSFNLILMASK